MDCEGIKIKIERNKYQTAALDFWIFNPETEQYDEKNAFSDENRLLKFTAETRNLDEYASEMLLTMLSTYKRLKKIKLEFYGDLADYDILNNSLTELGSVADCVINPHCDLDPEIFRKRINKAVSNVNKYLSGKEYRGFIRECENNDIYNGLFTSDYNFNSFNTIDNKAEGTELIDSARKIIEELKKEDEKASDMINICNNRIKGINKPILELSEKIDKKNSRYTQLIFKEFKPISDDVTKTFKTIWNQILDEDINATFCKDNKNYIPLTEKLKLTEDEYNQFLKKKIDKLNKTLIDPNNYVEIINILENKWSEVSDQISKIIETETGLLIYDDLNSSFPHTDIAEKITSEWVKEIYKNIFECSNITQIFFPIVTAVSTLMKRDKSYIYVDKKGIYNGLKKDYYIFGTKCHDEVVSVFIKSFKSIVNKAINDGSGFKLINEKIDFCNKIIDNSDLLRKQFASAVSEIEGLLNTAIGDGAEAADDKSEPSAQNTASVGSTS